jgi:hypothetical protein
MKDLQEEEKENKAKVIEKLMEKEEEDEDIKEISNEDKPKEIWASTIDKQQKPDVDDLEPMPEETNKDEDSKSSDEDSNEEEKQSQKPDSLPFKFSQEIEDLNKDIRHTISLVRSHKSKGIPA